MGPFLRLRGHFSVPKKGVKESEKVRLALVTEMNNLKFAKEETLK